MGRVYKYEVDEHLFSIMDIVIDYSCDLDGSLNRSVVYALINGTGNQEKVLYVGQTNVDPKIRIKNHLKNLKFSHVFLCQLDGNNRDLVNSSEQKYIHEMHPLLQNILTPFERINTNGPMSYTEILQWSEKIKKAKRPGRPRTKEVSKPINVNVPVRILDEIDSIFEKNSAIQLNKTRLIISLLERYIEENR